MYTVENVVIEVDNVEYEIDVEYSVYGGYVPETFFDPAEYPELEIDNLSVSLSEKDYQENKDVIEEVCWGHFNEEICGVLP